MAASTSGFVAGHYSMTWNALDIGTTEQGIQFNINLGGEEIRLDDLGDVVVDGINRGYNVTLAIELIKWDAAGIATLQFPFDAGVPGQLDGIGKPWSDYAKQLILTPTPGINTLAKTYTCPLAIPYGDHGGFNLNTKTKRMRANVRLLPYYDVGTGKWRFFTQA